MYSRHTDALYISNNRAIYVYFAPLQVQSVIVHNGQTQHSTEQF